jgi:Concanavalin A-like lectin/glucanases superfamily
VLQKPSYNNTAGSDWIGRYLTLNATAHKNRWMHIVATYDGSETAGGVKIYIDGIRSDTNSDIGGTYTGMSNTGKSVEIGSYNAGLNNLNGKIDDVRIYNYALTPAQIAWDYNRGGPVGWWKFDECTSTTAYDLSGKGNNGTITIGATGSQTAVGNCVTTDTAAAWYNGRNGKFNSSLNFDGTDDYVQIADIDTLRFDTSTQDFSLFAWVKRTITGTEYMAPFTRRQK